MLNNLNINFGVLLTMIFKPVVLDLSHHNTIQSFADMKAAGIVGIIHKCTEGTSYVDAKYASRKAMALKAGFLWGAYHFATNADVNDQVEHFLDTADADENTLLALDFEPNPSGGTMDLDQAREWLKLVASKTGQRPILYSGNLIKETLGNDDDEFFGSHRLWLAQYGKIARVPSAWNNWWLWQYAADGVGPEPHEVDGIDGTPDVNIYNGKVSDLIANWVDIPGSNIKAKKAPAGMKKKVKAKKVPAAKKKKAKTKKK